MPSTEQLPSGRYRAIYQGPDGKKKRVPGTFSSKREAKSAAVKAEGESRTEGWFGAQARKRTWGEWCEEWWPTRDIEPSTLKRQLTQRVKHIDPYWWEVPLEQFTRHDVRAWAVTLMQERNLSRASAQKLSLMLSASFTAAIDKGIMDANPAARLKLGTVKSNKIRFLTREQAAELRDWSPRLVDRALISTMLGAGLRWGEVAGLQVQRVDFEREGIMVTEVWDTTGRRLKEYPKDRRSRWVPISGWLLEVLKEQIGERRSGFVFEHNGYQIEYANWRKKIWLQAVEQLELAPLVIHDLRHTYASWLAEDGFTLLEIGQLLGHEDPSTTQIYAHLVDPNAKRVRKAIRQF